MSEVFRVEEAETLPKFELLPYSEKEFGEVPDGAREALFRASDGVWTLHNDDDVVLALGVVKTALIGPSELWVLVTKHFTENLRYNLQQVRQLMPLLRERYPHALVRIEADFEAGKKFASFFGFRNTGRFSIVANRIYVWYEV